MACVDIVKHPREDDITRLATDSYIWGVGRERERERERRGAIAQHGPGRLEALANAVWSQREREKTVTVKATTDVTEL